MVEPGPYATDVAGVTSLRTTGHHPGYAVVREATAKEWVLGDPAAVDDRLSHAAESRSAPGGSGRSGP